MKFKIRAHRQAKHHPHLIDSQGQLPQPVQLLFRGQKSIACRTRPSNNVGTGKQIPPGTANIKTPKRSLTVKKEYEEQYHRLEENHWWIQARRSMVRALVLQANPDRACRILEIGCSGGPMMEQLRKDGYGHVTGIDISADGIEICHQRGLTNAHVMDAQKLTFPDESFQLITASDVLEHLPDAPQAIREWWRVLKPGGSVIVFVPAFQFLWSEHDEINKHFRRYRRAELRQLLADHGFTVTRSSYWNFLLFGPVSVIRLVKRILPQPRDHRSDIRPTPSLFNSLLAWLMRCENSLLLRGINYPFGVSVMTIGRKPVRPD